MDVGVGEGQCIVGDQGQSGGGGGGQAARTPGAVGAAVVVDVTA